MLENIKNYINIESTYFRVGVFIMFNFKGVQSIFPTKTTLRQKLDIN
jgi:hypothetical protein